MSETQRDYERADRLHQDRLREAHAEREAAFDRGEISYADIFGSAEIAAPVDEAIASWRKAMKIAQRASDRAELDETFVGTSSCSSECHDSMRHTLACLRSGASAAAASSGTWLPLKRRAS